MMKSAFPASVDQLHTMLQFISENALREGFESDQTLQIELALEEAIFNIIEHGSSSEIKIMCSKVENGLEVRLVDGGAPFNPLEPLDAVPKGGYGIRLMTKIMDSVQYEFVDGCNILILKKFHSD